MTSARELWYVTRGSGVVALLLLTASVVAGILATLRVGTGRFPRFAVGRLHKNLTLLSVVFVVVHVVTTVADGYAPIGLQDGIVPFVSPYRPVWLGLGTVSFDLLLALVVTSYLRYRIGWRVWRGIHWLAYASWPVALLHSFGTGTDERVAWLVLPGFASLVAVALAVLVRVGVGGGDLRVRAASALAAVTVPLAVLAWYEQGPARRGWAARAGTPTRLLASHRVVRTVALRTPAPSAPGSFRAQATGTVTNSVDSAGRARVRIVLRLNGGPGGALRIDLRGTPINGGVSMDASGVSFVPATTRAVYLGSVTGLSGQTVAATVRDAAGDRLALVAQLQLDAASGVASGVVQAGTA